MNVFEIPVHPYADIFPMLSKDDLGELANDISENGLREPIVVQEIDGKVMLIDGRNRRAACELVHVEPEIKWLNGEDPKAYIWSTNGTRRHMTKGVKAMAYAQMYPEPGRRGKIGSTKVNQSDKPNHNYLAKARALLPYPHLVAEVMSGAKPLNKAYEEAKDEAQKAKDMIDGMAELRANDPVLASLVDEERLSLNEALETYRNRVKAEEERAKNQRMTLLDCLSQALRGGLLFTHPDSRKSMVDLMGDERYWEEFNQWFSKPIDRDELRQVSKALAQLAEEIR